MPLLVLKGDKSCLAVFLIQNDVIVFFYGVTPGISVLWEPDTMKRLYAVLLVSLLFLNLVGLFLYFPIQLFQIRSEMQARLQNLPDDQLEILSLSENAYQKALVDEGEVKVNGKMYDIARIRISNNQVTLYAIHDEAEDNLLIFLDTVFKLLHQDKKLQLPQILQFISLSFLPSPLAEAVIPEFAIIVTRTAYQIADFSYICSIESPPPRG